MNVLVEQEIEVVGGEEASVLRWRREQFRGLGFDSVDSSLLAESQADLGQARRLSEARCPLDVAFRILA
jgi:hypothetical protein